MPRLRPGARIGGAVLILCALVLAAIGILLVAFILDLPHVARLLPDGVRFDASSRPAGFADRLTDPAGLATVWVEGFALVTLLLGIDMLVFGRRSRWLFWPFLSLVAVFVATGVWAVLQSGGRMPRLHFLGYRHVRGDLTGFPLPVLPIYPPWFEPDSGKRNGQRRRGGCPVGR